MSKDQGPAHVQLLNIDHENRRKKKTIKSKIQIETARRQIHRVKISLFALFFSFIHSIYMVISSLTDVRKATRPMVIHRIRYSFCILNEINSNEITRCFFFFCLFCTKLRRDLFEATTNEENDNEKTKQKKKS